MMFARVLFISMLLGCGASTARPKEVADEDDEPLKPVVAKPKPPPVPEWATSEPTETRVVDPKGCEMPAWRVRAALSVDGTSAGVFLSRMSGAKGVVIVDPRGPTAARLSLGAATFDTRVALDESTLAFPQRPAPIGGILHPSEYVRARVSGGDASKLELTLVDADGIFEWTMPPTVSFECAAFAAKHASWPYENVPDGPKTMLPKSERLPVRASQRGDVVARVRVPDVHVMKEEKGVSAIVAWTSLGPILGWVDSAELVVPPPPTLGHVENHSQGGGSGMGFLGPTYATCVAGAPLLLLRHDKLYRVGHLHDTNDPPITPDWRPRPDGRVRLEIATSQPSPRHLVLADDFRVTNSFWHDGVSGQLVVPLGDAGCVKDAPPERPR
jgi:hypothetical protein